MTAPRYAWTCQRCGKDNGATQDICNACGLTAAFKAGQLAQGKSEPDPANKKSDDALFRNVVTFVPEAPIALFCAIVAPMRAFRLGEQGHIAAAFGLMFATVCALVVVYFAIVRKEKWIAYAAIMAYLLCVFYI